MRCRVRHGFSLTEVCVVTIVLSIVASVAVPAYLKSVEESRENRAVVALRTIRNSQEMYHLKNRTYTSDLDVLGFEAASVDDFTFQVSSLSANAYTITATRVDGPQYAMHINQLGSVFRTGDDDQTIAAPPLEVGPGEGINPGETTPTVTGSPGDQRPDWGRGGDNVPISIGTCPDPCDAPTPPTNGESNGYDVDQAPTGSGGGGDDSWILSLNSDSNGGSNDLAAVTGVINGFAETNNSQSDVPGRGGYQAVGVQAMSPNNSSTGAINPQITQIASSLETLISSNVFSVDTLSALRGTYQQLTQMVPTNQNEQNLLRSMHDKIVGFASVYGIIDEVVMSPGMMSRAALTGGRPNSSTLEGQNAEAADDQSSNYMSYCDEARSRSASGAYVSPSIASQCGISGGTSGDVVVAPGAVPPF